MAKAKKSENSVPEEDYNESSYNNDMDDFDVEEEFVPVPLIAMGFYNAAITEVRFNSEDKTIDWTATFNGNGGVMSDGETEIDGSTQLYRNWLPKPGDENERTKKGNQTKRQAKINMLHDFAEGMKIELKNPRQILEAIANSDWIGMEVQVMIDVRTWQGRTFNNIARMVAA